MSRKHEVMTLQDDELERFDFSEFGLNELTDLRHLQISGDKITTLPEGIGKLPSLTFLELDCPQLKTLPDSFINLITLEKFHFIRCNLNVLPSFICSWTALKELVIDMDNTLHGPYTDLKKMPENIGNLQNLSCLSFTKTSFTKIPDSLCNCPLEHLELTGEYKTLPKAFGKLSKLQTLELYSIKALSLPDSFGELLSLKNLEIYTPALQIPDSFVNLASLEDLSIMAEDLSLPERFGNLSSLKELGIDSANISKIPESIGGCRDLNIVFINSDKLLSLPESICKLKKLKTLHLYTFSLKSLPAGFGNLGALRDLHIFSGAITALPASMGKLKNIEYLILDFHNLTSVPDWLKNLPCIKEKSIQTAREDISPPPKKNKKNNVKILDFSYFANMSHPYRGKILESYNVKDLEEILCSAPGFWSASSKDKAVFKDIMYERRIKLNRKFKWTEENKKLAVKVSDYFLKAWEEGNVKARAILDFLHENDRDTFNKIKNTRVILYPEILTEEEGGRLYSNHLHDTITAYLNPEFELRAFIEYDPEKEDNEELHIHSFLKRDLSWNIEGFGDIELTGHYIGYSLYILYSHNNWANEDVLKVNNILTDVRISYENSH